MSRPVVILGFGGHARVVADACRESGRIVAGYVERRGAHAKDAGTTDLLGDDTLLDDARFTQAHEFLVGIGGDAAARCRIGDFVRQRGGTLTSVVHPRATVARDVRIGAGVVVAAGAVVAVGSVLHDFVVVNTAATVDHDGVLARGVHVAPGAHLAGQVVCEEHAFVGMGALVVQGLRVGARATVGAGAVVLSDVPDGVTVVGSPAKIVRG